ncbi:hypothetical protein RQP46_005782 [Phenoliferia psychrophenolica]
MGIIQSRASVPHLSTPTEPPRLPYELVAEILKLTIESLFEEERHFVSHVALTNHFLVSASLVNRTWRTISKKYWESHAMILPNHVLSLIEEQRGSGNRLERVRIGEGRKRARWWSPFRTVVCVRGQQFYRDELQDEALGDLVSSFKCLKTLEIAGDMAFRFPLRAGAHQIDHLILSNWSMAYFPSIADTFAISPPSHLTLNLTQPKGPLLTLLTLIPPALMMLTRLTIVTDHLSLSESLFPLLLLTSPHLSNQLVSLHLECHDPTELLLLAEPTYTAPLILPLLTTSFPKLKSLTMHLALAYPLALYCDLYNLEILTLPHDHLIMDVPTAQALLDPMYSRCPNLRELVLMDGRTVLPADS